MTADNEVNTKQEDGVKTLNDVILDTVNHGLGVSKDGKHVKHEDIFKSPEVLALEKEVKCLRLALAKIANGKGITQSGKIRYYSSYDSLQSVAKDALHYPFIPMGDAS